MLNLLNEASDSKFISRNWDIVDNQAKENYSVRNEIIHNTEELKANLRDYSDAYILVRADTTIIGHNVATQVAFKNFISFIKCITKIHWATKDNAENLSLVILMYNLLE